MTIYRQKVKVTSDEWRDALNFLMGVGTGATLSGGQQFVLKNLFGCNNDEIQATLALKSFGWMKNHECGT